MEMLTNIDVDDLEREWRLLRCARSSLARRLLDGSVAEMSGVSSKIHLMAKTLGAPRHRRQTFSASYERHWTPVHLDFEVADVESAVSRAVAAGATLESEIQGFNWHRMATLSDFFRHGFWLLQFIGKDYDEVA